MKLTNIIITLALVLTVQYAFAQPTGTRLPDKKVEAVGDERTEIKDTYNALEWYEKLYNRDEDNLVAIYKVASTHDKLRDYPNAAKWYEKLVNKDKNNEYTLARYYYARALKLNGEYDKCINEFKAFKKAYKEDQPEYEYFTKMADIQIEGARWARVNTEPKEELIIENAGKVVNSASTEGSPFPMGREQIIYTSLKSDTLIYLEEDEEMNKYAQIYMANAEENSWGEASEFNKDVIQKKGFHTGQPTFNSDLSKFYFTRAKLEGNELSNSRIYVCDYEDGKVGEPKLLDFNSNQFSCRNPSIAKWGENEFLLFSSNKEGGEGSYDIWYAEINDDGTTKQPLNLKAVNTIGEEISPFFDERDNTLYFSSNGHPGMGGYDIFKSQRNPSNGEMTSPENMGAGFNSRVDDFDFIINKQGNDDCFGYLVSNRPGTISLKSETCCDDIFSIIMPERCDLVCNVEIFDEASGEPLNGATVQLVDKETGKVIEEQSNTEGNDYTFLLEMGKEYEVRSKKESHETGTTPIDVTKETLKDEGYDLTKPIEFEEKVNMKELGLMVRTFDKKSNESLSGVTVIVYNAETEEEVKRMTIDESNEFAFVVPRNKDYKIFANREGYIADSRVVAKSDLGMLQKMYLTPPPVFYNVYFDFDKHNIREGANDTLDMVAKTLEENPEMIVEVLGHTDAKGTDTYNIKLSDKRADSAIKYLKDKGIDESRLVPKALGEEVPAADNKKPDGSDNPEGRQLNRRVEFKIVSMNAVGMNDSDTEKKK